MTSDVPRPGARLRLRRAARFYGMRWTLEQWGRSGRGFSVDLRQGATLVYRGFVDNPPGTSDPLPEPAFKVEGIAEPVFLSGYSPFSSASYPWKTFETVP